MGARYGGPPRVVLALGSELVRRGLDVSVWATGTADDKAYAEARGLAAHIYRPGWLKRWFRSSDLMRDLSDALSEVDILHLHGVWTHVQLASARLASRADVPYLLRPQGGLEPWRVGQKGFRKRLYLLAAGRRMLNSAACLHAITPAEIDGFRQVGYDGPVAIVPNGIDVPQYDAVQLRDEADGRWPVLRGRRVVLFLSRLSPEKGLDQLIPAFGDLARREAYDDVLLVLAGSGDAQYTKEVEASIERHGMQSRVITAGFVGGREKDMLISRADAYTLPSHSEGFSISVLENLAAGNPLLITPGCNFPEVAQVGAGLCYQPTREDLAQGLRELLDMSQAEAEVMGRRGRELVQSKYTWAVVVGKLMTVYDCILQGRSIPLHPEPMLSEVK
jgi:glycosyltransferase involved in cell wall biosynthesis